MKRILAFSILAALLGGCGTAPGGYGDNRDGYYRERGYSDGSYRNRDYYRGDGYYRDDNYIYRSERRNPSDPFQQHGN